MVARAISVLTVGLMSGSARAGLFFTGVNLSGAEFGQTHLPGTYNTDYTYPTNSEVDYFVGKGLNTIRLPFRWERLQRSQNAALDSTELSRMVSFVNYATSKGVSVILDPHNFDRYFPLPAGNYQNSTIGVVGKDVPNSSFNNFWNQLAAVPQFTNNKYVMFNLMNEPANVNTDIWVGSANAAIAGIRAAGATNIILVPGNRYTGAWTWNNADSNGRSNAAAMLDITDPLNNFAFDVHQYLDSDGSGTSASIANNDPTVGVQRLISFTQWLYTNNRRGFLGEFAVDNSMFGTSASQIGDETLSNMLNYLDANSQVWMGWTAWGGGPWWASNSLFHLDPVNGVDAKILPTLQAHAGPAIIPEPTSAWLIFGFATSSLRRNRKR